MGRVTKAEPTAEHDAHKNVVVDSDECWGWRCYKGDHH